MTPRPNDARPKCEALELREAPASVSQLTEYRPLDFQIDGTVQTTDVHPYSKAVGPASDSFSGTFTATGRITYDANGGQSGAVKYSATGDGTSAYTTTEHTEDGNQDITVDYHATETGSLTFRDSNGTWSTTGSFTRTSARTFNSITTEKVTLGPSGVKLNFDPSTMTVSGGWASQSGANATSGSLVGTITQPSAAATDLSVSAVKLSLNDEGYEAKFSIGVSGALMTPPDKASPAAIASVQWTDGTGRSEDANATVNVAWNAGKVSADVAGLEAPEWATGLKVVVAANGWTESATLTNNTGAADLGSAETPVDPTSPPPPPAEPDPSSRGVVVGATSPAVLDVYGPRGDFKFSLAPYGDSWTGGISVATGDVTGDGVMDIITGAGAGGGPHVKVFDGATAAEVMNFFAFDASFSGGVNVAAGDVDGDGGVDIIVGAGKTGGPHVKVFDGQTGDMLRSFFAFDANSRNGVSVAAADFDNNGIAEIVTGSGVGERPEVHVYGAADAPISSFATFDNNFRTGSTVSTRKLPDGRIVIVSSVDLMYDLPDRQFDVDGNEVA